MINRKIKSLAMGVAVLFLVAGIFTIVVLQNHIAEARAENASLQATRIELQRLQTENADLDQLRSVNEQVAQLKLANKDLPRLRNQIRQLRSQAAEVAKLQSENKKLAAAQNQTSPVPEGFISKSALRDVGYSSPEAALQTFFYCASIGDYQGMLRGVAGGEYQSPDPEQSNLLRKQMDTFPGLGIVETKLVSPTLAEIKVRTGADGQTQTFKLVRLNDVWKIAEN